MHTLFPCFPKEMVYPFSQGNGIHHSIFCFVVSGSGDRPREEGCHGGVYYFFPGFRGAGVMILLGMVHLRDLLAKEVQEKASIIKMLNISKNLFRLFQP